MRISSALLALVLVSACSGGTESEEPQGEAIDCALAGAAEFERVCTYEELLEEQQVVIWHPDGGFRRFDLLPGGAGVASADGAEQVIQGIMGGMLEVTVGDDRYRLPTAPMP